MLSIKMMGQAEKGRVLFFVFGGFALDLSLGSNWMARKKDVIG